MLLEQRLKSIRSAILNLDPELIEKLNFVPLYPDLGQWCAITSFYIQYSLKHEYNNIYVVAGVFDDIDDVDFHEGDLTPNHCWVRIKSKIIDLTATQFGDYPEIFLTTIDNEIYKPLKEFEKFSTDFTIYWANYEQTPTKELFDAIDKLIPN